MRAGGAKSFGVGALLSRANILNIVFMVPNDAKYQCITVSAVQPNFNTHGAAPGIGTHVTLIN